MPIMEDEKSEGRIYAMKENVDVMCSNCHCKQKHVPTGEIQKRDCFNKTTKIEVRCSVCFNKKWVEEQIFQIKRYADENNDASRM